MTLDIAFEGRPSQEWRVTDAEKINTSPRIIELPANIPVEGFLAERESFIRSLVESVGLPLNNVSSIVFRENMGGQESIAGSVHMLTGELSFYKRMEGLPEIAQLGVAVHELAHENDPHDPRNIDLFGSREQMEEAAGNVRLVALQTDVSRKYLNGYHRLLHEALTKQNIDTKRFLQETHAIMLELRFTNPKHLEEVLRAQNPDTVDAIIERLDESLMKLMNFATRNELDSHIQNLRNHYKKQTEE